MSRCKTCSQPNPHFRVVQTILERNAIPCSERVDGMLVVVVQDNYKRYMLQGGNNYCSNKGWTEYGLTIEAIQSLIGQTTILSNSPILTGGKGRSLVVEEAPSTQPGTVLFSDAHLNQLFPDALEGFRVTVPSFGSTFTKLSNSTWVITNNLLNNESNTN